MTGIGITLDCSACKRERTMTAAKIARFGAFIRFLGYIIVAPSVLGVLIAVVYFVAVSSSSSGSFAAVAHGIALVVAAGSLVAGLIGWLLLSTRKVYKCAHCGYILERA